VAALGRAGCGHWPDFPAGVPKAIRYGVDDVGANDGFVAVGIDHDTAAFAVNTIDTWWERVGRIRYPNANRLMITADAGGSTADINDLGDRGPDQARGRPSNSMASLPCATPPRNGPAITSRPAIRPAATT
jgi:hypothetical protein